MGFLRYSPQSFFMLEPRECIKIIEQSNQRFKYEHRLQYVATLNAIGNSLSKDYKYKDMFESEPKKKEVTQEEKEEMKDYLLNW